MADGLVTVVLRVCATSKCRSRIPERSHQNSLRGNGVGVTPLDELAVSPPTTSPRYEALAGSRFAQVTRAAAL